MPGITQHFAQSAAPRFKLSYQGAEVTSRVTRPSINWHACARDDRHCHGAGKRAAIAWAEPGTPAIHGPRPIDQQLDRLTKNLELTPKQRKQVRPLLEEHHDKIQALFDKSPGVSRQDLGPLIHAINEETHHQIDALLSKGRKLEAEARCGKASKAFRTRCLSVLLSNSSGVSMLTPSR
jgi:hypothetical protein